MLRTATVLAVLAVSFAPASALACGMYIPSDDVNLAELLGEIDGAAEVDEVVVPQVDVAVPEVVPAPTVVEVEVEVEAEVEPAPQVAVKKGLFRKARPSS